MNSGANNTLKADGYQHDEIRNALVSTSNNWKENTHFTTNKQLQYIQTFIDNKYHNY